MFFSFAADAGLYLADLVVQHADFLYFVTVECRLGFHGLEETIFMEAMHAWENVEFGVEEGFEALLAFVAGVNFNATIFDKTKLVFQLISIGGVAVHEIFKSVDFLAVGF